MKSYEGQESYIFFSYCHADKEKVLAVADKLFQMNFRVWYDKYLDIGEPFDDDIAEHIRNCEVFIIFLSEDYLKSEYCDMELKYAQSKGRKCFAVYLSDVDMENYAGMEMCLRSSNNITNAWLYDAEKCAELIAGSKLVVDCKRKDGEPYEPVVLKDKLRKSKTAYLAIPVLSFFTFFIFITQTHEWNSTFLVFLQALIFIISCVLFYKQEKKYKYQTEKPSKYSIWLLITAFFNLDTLSMHLCVDKEVHKQIIIMLAVSVLHYVICMTFISDKKTLPSWDISAIIVYIIRFAVLLTSMVTYSVFPEYIRWAAAAACFCISFGFITSAGLANNKTTNIISCVFIVICLLFMVSLLFKKSFDWIMQIASWIDYNIFLQVFYYIRHRASDIYRIIFIE